MNFQYGVSPWCCVDALMLYWERKQQEQFLKFLIRNYSMPSHTSYQVLLMFQFIFNMLVCPCTGHVLFSWDKPCLLIGSPHQYTVIWDSPIRVHLIYAKAWRTQSGDCLWFQGVSILGLSCTDNYCWISPCKLNV